MDQPMMDLHFALMIAFASRGQGKTRRAKTMLSDRALKGPQHIHEWRDEIATLTNFEDLSVTENETALTVNKPKADDSVAIHLLGEALSPKPVDSWMGEKDSQTRRVGKELISMGFARRVKAPRNQRHLLQKFVVATTSGRLLRDKLLKKAWENSQHRVVEAANALGSAVADLVITVDPAAPELAAV